MMNRGETWPEAVAQLKRTRHSSATTPSLFENLAQNLPEEQQPEA